MRFGKILIEIGVVLVAVGVILTLFEKFNFRLPGDIYIKKDNFEFYFPIVTSLLISLILTIILNLFLRK